MLKERGAYPVYNVSSKTDILIVGERPGIKLERAITLGVRIVPGYLFESMLTQYDE
jgi:NAD-dependent DNA ligase